MLLIDKNTDECTKELKIIYIIKIIKLNIVNKKIKIYITKISWTGTTPKFVYGY